METVKEQVVSAIKGLTQAAEMVTQIYCCDEPDAVSILPQLKYCAETLALLCKEEESDMLKDFYEAADHTPLTEEAICNNA